MRKLLTFSIALTAIVFAIVSPVSAQVGGLMFPGPGSFASSGGGRTCTDDTASTNFLTRTGGSAPNYGAGSARYADAICTFIKALETAGLITGNLSGTNSCGAFTGNTVGWDGVYLAKAHTSANSLLNICGTANPLVNHGDTFTADVGYTAGTTSSYIDSQIAPGTNFLQNNASIWSATSTTFVTSTDYGSMAGNGSGTLNVRLYPHYSNNSFYSAVNQSTLNTDSATPPGSLYGATRSNSTQMQDYIDTGTIGLQSWASITPVGPTLIFMNDGTSATAAFQGVMTFGAVGGGLTSTQEGALASAVAAYVASVP